MRRSLTLLVVGVVSVIAVRTAEAATCDSGVCAEVTADRVVLANGLALREWDRAAFATASLVDQRTGTSWTKPSADFVLRLAGLELPSTLFAAAGVEVTSLPRGGLRVRFDLRPASGLLPLAVPLALPLALAVERVVEAYPGVAGFRSETTITSAVPLVLSGYDVERIAPAVRVAATSQSFRAGGDWREPGWPGPPATIGDPHGGTWRVSYPAKPKPGEAVRGTAQWMSLAARSGERAFLVLERNDYASSTMAYDGTNAAARVDLSRDVLYLGPFEEQAHVENPALTPARHRVVMPGRPLRLEPAFLGIATNPDDEAWQYHRSLAEHRTPEYPKAIVFNSNGVDADRISTGAKDDMDFAEIERQVAVARRLGVETFVLDDGWQARSGDWCPDSPECPEPRSDGSATPKFAPRFPDASFAAVREELGEMALGLWMSPMHFHPSAAAFAKNPQWACMPLSLGLVALNLAQPDEGSNEAGIGMWNPEAIGTDGTKLIDYVEGRIRHAIVEWGVRYFKFDFLAWVDCVGIDAVDVYSYRESFLAMLDRLIAAHPAVTFQIDETNDYRLFPFESLVRGPSWYQNGSPLPHEALHSAWVLAPFVPPSSLGRNALARWDRFDVDFLMAIALASHFTFFGDLTEIPDDVVDRVRVWTDYYKAHRSDLTGLTYPLLDDPYPADGWSALQPWNPEIGRGFLLVYRQGSAAAVRTVSLRNVPPDRTFRLFEAPTDAPLGTRTSAELGAGIEIEILLTNRARAIRIEAEP